MHTTRRSLLKAGGAVLTGTALAGCSAMDGEKTEPTGDGSDGGSATVAAEIAVAAEWNAMRMRAADALALGVAGKWGDGQAVAEDIFARFEQAGGEWGAHTLLEKTSHEDYEEFEEALGELAADGLGAEDVERARTEAGLVDEHLRNAQVALVGEDATLALDVLVMGAAAENATMLAASGDFEAAATVCDDVLAQFEEAGVHEALEDADHDAYEAFESNLKAAKEAASAENTETVEADVRAAMDATVTGAYALAPEKKTADSGSLAAMQGRAYDAATLAGLGGPSTEYAHAGSLTIYRAHAADARWLAAHGETELAAQIAADIFAHFEGAKAHEALEDADHDAYEGFEHGLDALGSAIEAGDAAAIDDAVSQVDSNLVVGIETLAANDAAILEAGFFRCRVADAWELAQVGDYERAKATAQNLFSRFEANEADFHEQFEHADHEAYESFEGSLESLIEAAGAKDDAAVETHATATLSALLGFETMAGGEAQVSVAEAAFMDARAYDAAALAALGESDRAGNVIEATFAHFEEGAGGFHKSLEHADNEAYETFEGSLSATGDAATSGDVYAKAQTFNADAVAATYAVVGAAGGDFTAPAAGIAQAVFASFEEATVHEALEEADHSTYETFEATLTALQEAIESGSGVSQRADAFATATLRAQFAVVGALDQAPVEGESGGEESGETDTSLSGGPNVVEGTPDADHTIEVKAVSFDPAELSIKKGDTVAWVHAGGEAHTVTCKEGGTPDDAYFASGGFESAADAEAGWEDGHGAVQSGQAFVHTFETAGEYAYKCIPHAAAGMEGTITVE